MTLQLQVHLVRTTTPGDRRPTIPIVDDTPANLGVAAELLEQVGYRVLVAQEGEEAWSGPSVAGDDQAREKKV